MTYAHRLDANQNEIVAAFERLGCSVIDLSAVGKGVPDLAVSVFRATCFVEIKTLEGELEPSQIRFHRESKAWIEVAGHFIPMVVENVRGAQKWVGRSRWNHGAYHLWGDIPALMPCKANDFSGIKQGGDWFNASQPYIARRCGSKSKARKAASAAIAKIPEPLARHIARYWLPIAA